ncbi:MAG: hypothetical protein Q8R07_01155 [Candidatus Uhrbacteria bacterium]|nr:hypothetical protein [Candidatus Uhrbacteria bacterium]
MDTPHAGCQLTDKQILDLLELRKDLGIFSAQTNERFNSNLQALTLQAREYERRLENLNGEQARIKEERTLLGEQLRREMEMGTAVTTKDISMLKENIQREVSLLRESLAAFVAEQRGVNRGIGLVWAVLIAVLTVGVSAGTLWVSTR